MISNSHTTQTAMAPKKMDTTRLHDIFMHDTPPSKAILSLMSTVNIVSFLKLLNMGFYKSKQLNKDDYSDVELANWDLITEHRVLFLGGHVFIGDKVMLKLQGTEEGDSISIMIKDLAGTMHEMNVHPGQVLDLKELYMVDPESGTDGIEEKQNTAHEEQMDELISMAKIIKTLADRLGLAERYEHVGSAGWMNTEEQIKEEEAEQEAEQPVEIKVEQQVEAKIETDSIVESGGEEEQQVEKKSKKNKNKKIAA